MKSEQVTLAWEFYRDNCEGFKEPMRKELRKLDDYVASVEAENAKLRELVRHLRECTRHNVCAVCEYADDACDFDYDLRELGVEVDDA